jgi:dolichyl-phosphate-mannose--protein O-mannosyl transferase
LKLDQTQTTMLVAVLFLTLLVYLRCLGNGFVNDERWEVVENRYLEQWSFFWNSLTRDAWWFSNPHRLPQSAYYRPIQNLWIALNFHLFGLNPIGWRAVKVLLHLCAVILVFRVSQLLSRSVSAALLSALLFGLLPVNTESVVWSVGPPQAAVL